ncbi:hypothetical protein ACS5UA_17750 [Brucella sp. RRSP16]|uniref:hypothetical protein n=1 Tax=Brucella TaxID=234 RepID=UPI00046A9EB8|nr:MULTISPECIES: hypothetical protein [Brucella]MBM7327824.1 hypothetical protein [Agrobacterium sp. S2]MCH6205543.1 hypothetical protein [Brucella ciceri]
MPLFNEASRIYHPLEVNFMRSCFSHAAILLEESDQDYSAADLTSYIIMLYQSGLRDQSYICEIAARLARQRFERHQVLEHCGVANNNEPTRKATNQPIEYDPLA